MQHELDATPHPTPIRILGINEAGYESDNDAMCLNRTLPWLQDTSQKDVWSAWHVQLDDIVILDVDNHVIRTYPLSTHDLGNPNHYAELEAFLLSAAQ